MTRTALKKYGVMCNERIFMPQESPLSPLAYCCLFQHLASSGCYPLAWLTMFIVAPSIGTVAAHTHPVTELLTYIGVGGLLFGIAILLANLFLGLFSERNNIQ
ncbi:MAG: hypothetical protein NTV37_04910 [Proteobacteria bacterium]|nr:hypothetical protein [Pseudomonadota bacterium]